MASRGECSVVLLAALTAIVFAGGAAGQSAAVPPLQLEAEIPLGDVRGRIDHMAVDLARHRLFVAALASDGVAVGDPEAPPLAPNVTGLPRPPALRYGIGAHPL